MTKAKLKAWRTLSTLTVVPRAGYADYWGDDPDCLILEAVEDIERREAPWSRPGGPWEGAVRMNKRGECSRDDQGQGGAGGADAVQGGDHDVHAGAGCDHQQADEGSVQGNTHDVHAGAGCDHQQADQAGAVQDIQQVDARLLEGGGQGVPMNMMEGLLVILVMLVMYLDVQAFI